MEIVTVGSTTDYRHYLSDVAILTKTGALNDPHPGIAYLHRDRLGSLATITDENGGNAQARGFDPFGKPREGDWADRSPPTLDSAITERGFTEHEHLDDSKLIHMNGRVYDYQLGKFLSVDPIIQAPGNSESLNPYSFIMNNPLAGTDPSGYQSTCETDNCNAEQAAQQTIAVTRAGSRIEQTVTATARAVGSAVSVVFSGSDGASVLAVKGGIAALANEGFSVTDIGGASLIANTNSASTVPGHLL